MGNRPVKVTSTGRTAARAEALELKRKCPRCAIVLDDRRLNAGMNRLPHGQVDAHHPPSLCHIGVARNGHIEAISAALRRDESASLQKTLQVTKEAWSVEEDVHGRKWGARELPQPKRLLLLSSEIRLRQEVIGSLASSSCVQSWVAARAEA